MFKSSVKVVISLLLFIGKTFHHSFNMARKQAFLCKNPLAGGAFTNYYPHPKSLISNLLPSNLYTDSTRPITTTILIKGGI